MITLGIIGVVASITIPQVIAKYSREVTSTRLKKFYSAINQVVLKARADGNDWEFWAGATNLTVDNTSATAKAFVDTYIANYMNYTKIKESANRVYVYLNDGTYFYICKGSCLDLEFDTNGDAKPNVSGRDRFRFLYCPNSASDWIANSKVIPYQPKSMKTREAALSKCKTTPLYCSALLFFDGWEFKKDYPYQI